MKTTRNIALSKQTLLLATLPFLALAAGCKAGGTAKAQPVTKGAVATIISASKASQESIARHVDVTGTLAAWEEATVSLEAEGRVIDVKVDLGDKVKKGAVLARLSPENYVYRSAQAEAELAAAEADFKRVETLVKQEMASQQQLDESRRRLGLARASSELAKKQVSDATLRAPIEGTISRRMVNLGEYVRVGTAAFGIVTTNPLKLQVEVPERFIGDVAVGDLVEATCDALPNTILQGKVSRVGPAVAANNRSFPVEARFDVAGQSVKPGTFARATIISSKSVPSVLVPESAITTFAGTPRVFVVEGGKVKERTIELAGRHQGRALVASGLAEGEVIASSNVGSLVDGATVSLREASAL